MSDGRLVCLDRDPSAVAEAGARFAGDARVSVFLAPFSSLAQCADQVEPGLTFEGILFDLGVSSPQLDDASRGFSFMNDGPLDMRMNPELGDSAADVVNGASEKELIRIFREFGEEKLAPRIARAIVADRVSRPFERTLQLAEMIARVARSKEAGGRPKEASGYPRVPGAAHPREQRARRAGDRAGGRLRAAGAARTPGGHQFSFARGSHGEAISCGGIASTDPVYAGLPVHPRACAVRS